MHSVLSKHDLHAGYFQLVDEDGNTTGNREALLYSWQAQLDGSGRIQVDLYSRHKRVVLINGLNKTCRPGLFTDAYRLLIVPDWNHIVSGRGSLYTIAWKHWDPTTGLYTTADTTEQVNEAALQILAKEGLA